MSNTGSPVTNLAAIDAAIARAKAAKALKDAGGDPSDTPTSKPVKEPKTPRAEKAPKTPKEKPVKEPKPARQAAHLAKVEKAASNLPALSDEAQMLVTECIAPERFLASELNAIAAHLCHAARMLNTSAAINASKPEVGAYVLIASGDHGAARYIGMNARLTEVRNIRCFADVFNTDGSVAKKGLYLLISDVRVVDEPAEEDVVVAEPATEFPADVAAENDQAEVPSEEDQAAADETLEDAAQPTGTEG